MSKEQVTVIAYIEIKPGTEEAFKAELEKVIAAINQADLSEQEKDETKSLLRKLLSSKAVAKVLDGGAQSLAAKYFAG